MSHVYFTLLTILYASTFTAVHAAHLKTLGLRALHTSAATSAMRYQSFPRNKPYLFVATNNCSNTEDHRFQHRAKSFNKGQAVILTAVKHKSSYKMLYNLFDHAAVMLIESMHTDPLTGLLHAPESYSSSECMEVVVRRAAQNFNMRIMQECSDKENIFNYMFENNSFTGLIVAASRYAHRGNHIYAYPIASNSKGIIINPPIERFDTGNWYVQEEECGIDQHTLAKFRNMLEVSDLSPGSFIAGFAERHMPTDSSGRLLALNLSVLKEHVKEDNN